MTVFSLSSPEAAKSMVPYAWGHKGGKSTRDGVMPTRKHENRGLMTVKRKPEDPINTQVEVMNHDQKIP